MISVSFRAEAAEMHVFLAVLSVSIAMLGAGSVDARLFGGKRFGLKARRGTKAYS